MSSTIIHEVPDFAEFLTNLVNGDVNNRLTDELREVTEAVHETGLVGELRIVLKIKKEGSRAMVSTDITKKVPEHPIHGTLFYFGNGGLVRDDPRQMSMKGLEAPRLRKVDDE